MSSTDERLALALTMRDRAYAPYSKFPVAAVMKGANGKLYGGCNVENAAYPLGNCAEATAIFSMVADGERKIVEVLVLGPEGELITPCGSCRQRMREFASDDLPIHLAGIGGINRTVTLGELLPLSFGPSHLGK